MKLFYDRRRTPDDDARSFIAWFVDNIGDQTNNECAYNANLGSIRQEGDFAELYGIYQAAMLAKGKQPWLYHHVDSISAISGAGWTALMAIHIYLNERYWVEQWIIDIPNDALAVQFKLAML